MKPEDVDAELVEKAARAKYDADPYRRPDGSPWPWEELDLADIQEIRTETRHALAAVIPLVQAEALEEAARDLRAAYKDPPTHVLTVPQRAAWQTGMARAHGIVRDLSRAARLTATSGEATTPVHVGGRVNAEDCPACSPAIDPPPYPWICPGPTEAKGPRT